MLSRVLEPEVMDTEAEARDYDDMDHRAVNDLFVSDFLKIWDGCNPVLDIGTGTAQIPIALCKASVQVRVVGVDLADQMLRVGRRNVRRAALDERITLELQDAKHLPYDRGSFPAVISNSIIHHIPHPLAVVAEMVRVLATDGTLLVRDLLRPPDMESLQRLGQTYAGDANAHQQQLFADSLNAALTLDEVRALVAEAGMDASAVEKTSDRHWTWTIRPGKR